MKHASSFSIDRQRPNGRAFYCKPCRSETYQERKHTILPQYQEYRKRHKERLRVQRRNWDYSRFFYKRASNLLTRRGESGKGEIRKTLPGKCAEISLLWKKQRGRCPLTGRRLTRENAQLDHIVAIKNGGGDEIENMRWVHRDVNYAKRDLTDEQLLSLCSDVVSNMVVKPAG